MLLETSNSEEKNPTPGIVIFQVQIIFLIIIDMLKMLLLHLCWAGSKVSALCRVPLAAPFATSDDIGLISIHYYWLSGSLSCKHCNIFRDNENDKNETWISRLARSSGWWETEESRPRETREERLPWPAHQLGNWFIKMGHGRYNNKKHKKWHKKQKQQEKPAKRNQGGDLPIIRILWIIFTSLNILTATEINLLPPSSPRGPGSPCLLSDLL